MLGNLSWVTTTVTTVLGVLLFRDRFGAFDDEADTPCARGDAIIASTCEGTPVPHAVLATLAFSTFWTNFGITYAMPDPTGMDEGDGEHARRLRRHKTLRWVLAGLFVVQTALGIVSANLNDYDTRRALSAVHMGLGAATYTTMFTQGILGSLMAY